MQKLSIYFFLSILFITNLKATNSEGTPYLIHFTYEKHTHNQIWSIEQSSRKTILIAKRTGLLEFDSENWDEISTPDIPLKIYTSNKQETYICGRGYIGKLVLNNKGHYNVSLHKHSKIKHQLFSNILETETGLFYYSPNLIVEENLNEPDSLETWEPEKGKKFGGFFKLKNHCYAYVKGKGIKLLNDSVYINTTNIGFADDEELVFSTEFNEDVVLLGTSSGNLYLFDGEKLSSYELNDISVLSSGVLTDGVSLNNNQVALSTRNSGVLIIDKNSRELINIIGHEAGLPTNHIMTLMVDSDAGLWLAHTKGLTRVDAELPISYYSSYAGLDAGVNAVRFWNDRLFLATTAGVYSLDSVSHYDTREVTRRIPIKQSRQIESINIDENELVEELKTPTGESSETTEEQTNKKGFLRNLFGKKKSAEPEVVIEEKDVADIKETPVKTKVVKPPKKQYQSFKYETIVLTSKSYGYASLQGIDEQCNYLLPFSNHLLAVTDSKIYAIDKNKSVNEIFASSHIYKLTVNPSTKDNISIITADGIYSGTYINNEWKFTTITLSNFSFKITAISQLTESDYLLALNNQLVYYSTVDDRIKTIFVENPYSEKINLKTVGNNHYVIVGRTFYYVHGLDYEDITLQQETDFSVIQPYMNQPDNLWIRTENREFKYFGKNEVSTGLLAFLKVFKDINDIHLDADSNIWIVDDYENIYKIGNSYFDKEPESIELSVKSIVKASGEYINLNNLDLSYSENALRFTVIAPTYLQNNSNQYQYIIEGLTTEWSEWSADNTINVPYLPSGRFTLKVRAKNILGHTSDIRSINFKISPPFWKTPYFFAVSILILILLIYMIQQYRMKKLVKEKKVLSKKVRERTIELELKNKAITDSINYAGKMQSALLPSEDVISSCLTDNFIFFKPRNIVSGDFYWATQKNQYTIVAAADCTGHGVPGAFMSMLGMALMSEIVNKTKIKDAAQILNILRTKIIQLLTAKHAESKDGMDIALLVFDKENNSLQYAGAHNPLYRLVPKSNELAEEEKAFVSKESDKHYLMHYKANRFHVGKSNFTDKPFNNHTIKYNPGDVFYIFSDGFPDQFGGEEERKFMYGPFKKMFLDIVDKPMDEQLSTLDETITEWMKGYEQTDDMLIFGIKP